MTRWNNPWWPPDPHRTPRSVAICVAMLLGVGHQLRGQVSHTLGTPLPIDVIVSLRGHNARSPINLSPDGEWIAHTIEGDGTIPRDSVSRRYSATGFPFAEGDSRMEATLSNTRTAEVIRLGDASSASWAPVWSPDGNRVAFYSDEGGEAGVWIWDRTTRTATRFPHVIARPLFGFERIEWLPDNHRLLVKILPMGQTVAQANAVERVTGQPAVPTPGVQPGSPAVTVRRFDPRDAVDSSTNDTRAPRYTPAEMMRWAEVDLAILDLRTESVRRVVEQVAVRAYARSPDGRYVAYTISKGGEQGSQQPIFDLVVHDLAGGQSRTLVTNTRLGYGIEWSWSPDSRTIALISSGQLGSGEIVMYNVANGAERSLKRDDIPPLSTGEGEYPPLWDARGENLYAVGDSSLWRVNIASGTGTRVSHIPGWQVRSPVWQYGSSTIWSSDNGRTVWVTARRSDGARSGIYAVDSRTGHTRPVVDEPNTYYSVFNVAASNATGEIAFVSAGQQSLPEIWMLDTKRGQTRQASHINAALDRYPLGDARVIDWQTTDGQPLRGARLLPPGYEAGMRVPLVVWVYGGDMGSRSVNRFGLTGIGAAFNMHVLATRGYAVLYPDAPVREGMTMADHFRTVMPGVDAAIEQGFADPDRLAVMGQSYGSYSTLSLITQTTRFKAAVITAAVIHPDLVAAYLESIGYYERGQGNMGGTIWEYRDRYRYNSPIFLFDRIETPLLIGQGERDGDLVPSDAIFNALERLGKPVEYRVYQGEGHVITQRANVIDFWQRRLEFLADRLDLVVDSSGAVVFAGGRAKSRAH